MSDIRITKRSPISINFFQPVASNKKAIEAYLRLRLTPSEGAKNAANDVASKVVAALRKCPKFVGRAVQSGSVVRDVSLKKPLWSDVDVVCFIHRDKRGAAISSFAEFEKARFGASDFIENFLNDEIGKHFPEATVVKGTKGFVIKLEVKRNAISIRPWCIDVLLAFDLEINNNVPQWAGISQELENLEAKKFNQTSSMAPYRDAFLKGIYARAPRLKGLVRALKAYYRILTSGERESTVNGFFFEMLAVALFANGLIPANFSMPRALATCFQAIARPSKVPALSFPEERGGGGDAMDRPAPPTDDQLAAMKKKAGANCLVIVDPFAPFNNLAARKKKQTDAWPVLEEGAANILQSLESRNVIAYAF